MKKMPISSFTNRDKQKLTVETLRADGLLSATWPDHALAGLTLAAALAVLCVLARVTGQLHRTLALGRRRRHLEARTTR